MAEAPFLVLAIWSDEFSTWSPLIVVDGARRSALQKAAFRLSYFAFVFARIVGVDADDDAVIEAALFRLKPPVRRLDVRLGAGGTVV